MIRTAGPEVFDPDSLDAALGALADRTRRRLLELVHDVERSAGDLAHQCPEISRPAVSQHLKVLHDAGLVTVRPQGNRRYYRARTEGLDQAWRFIDRMWTDRLRRLKNVAEEIEQSEGESP